MTIKNTIARAFSRTATATLGATLLLCLGTAQAASVGYRTAVGSFGGLGGASGFDALFTAHGDTRTAINFSNAAAVNAADGLWINGGTNVLNGTEQANLLAFLNAGGRAVYITDRSDSGPWSGTTNSILSIFGADDIITGGDNSAHATVGSHELVDGVTTLRFNTWSAVDAGLASPTLLTANGMTAVYGVGAGSLLFIGDLNWQNGSIGADGTTGADDVRFANNIVGWLTGPRNAVPEPSSLLLVGAAALALRLRSRKTAA